MSYMVEETVENLTIGLPQNDRIMITNQKKVEL